MNPAIDRLTAALGERYRIERELGAGGMATVYLAQDLKHDRKVAIKVLKPELAAVLGAERFVQEIKTTAALSHPHILPLFDSGEAGGFLYYVMPYIQGETIREKLTRETQFGIDEAVKITTEVADALDYAHRHGVIHRDIKPENILLHDGRPMVMDFGIALAVSAAAGGRMTETGLSLGTPHYMSPEQATADKQITARSDIYSLGSVLYEMLAGVPPHEGGSAQQVIMRIIADTPRPVSELRRSVPPNVAAALAKALEKLPADRFESARAFADALGNPAFARASYAGAADPGRGRVGTLPFLGVSLLAIVGMAGWLWSATHRPAGESQVAVRFAFSAAPAQEMTLVGRNLALSPDGNTLVYSTGDSAGVTHLYRRAMDDLQQTPIAGTEGASNPFFSYDGREIGFMVGTQLKKIAVSGGLAIVLADIHGFRGASWSPAGIVVSSDGNLFLVPGQGGTPVSVASSDSVRGFWPVVLPGGKAAVYSTYGIADHPFNVVSLSDGRTAGLVVSGSVPLGVVGGDLVFVRSDGQLFAVPFDPGKLRVTGSPRAIGVEVSRTIVNGEAKAVVSLNGTLSYVTGSGLLQTVSMDLHGIARALPIRPGRVHHPRYAPDGKKVAADVSSSGRTELYVFDAGSGAARRLTSDGTVNERPEWSAGGDRILYKTDRAGDNSLWWMPADGTGAPELLVASAGRDIWQGQLSPDGRSVLYRTGGGGTGDIWYMPVGDTGAKAFATTRFNELGARFSPDGHWVAYYSDESGSYQVYVRPFPGPGAAVPVSVNGGEVPVWSPDGRTIFFVSGRQLTAASVVTTPSLAVTRRDVLFERDFVGGAGHADYDVAPDGKSFLMLIPAPGEAERIIVVRNWAAELEAGSGKGSTP